MAEGTDFNVKFTGSSAQALVNQINTELGNATTAHTNAVNAWKTVKSKFALNPATMAKLNSIDEEETGLDTVEFQKVVTSLQNLMSGIGNINTTWQNAATEIDSAINTYINGSGN